MKNEMKNAQRNLFSEIINNNLYNIVHKERKKSGTLYGSYIYHVIHFGGVSDSNPPYCRQPSYFHISSQPHKYHHIAIF